MSVITISRGSFSGGKALAECLSRLLAYRCIDREVIVERAAAKGVSQEELRDAMQRPPSFLERLQHRKYLYLVLMQASLAEEVRAGQAVYHGNAGHLLLKGARHILRVRIIAPLEMRVKAAQDRLRLSRVEALDDIGKMDQDRRKWTQYLYGVDWNDPANYDIVLNLGAVPIPDACQTIATLARRDCFAFTPDCQAAMEDLALASRVRAELALDARTAHLEFEVEAMRGAVSVHGAVSGGREQAAIRRIGAAVPGVNSITVDETGAGSRPR